jgi:hypothetical protein
VLAIGGGEDAQDVKPGHASMIAIRRGARSQAGVSPDENLERSKHHVR